MACCRGRGSAAVEGLEQFDLLMRGQILRWLEYHDFLMVIGDRLAAEEEVEEEEEEGEETTRKFTLTSLRRCR